MALGKAFIEVHADTKPFARELGRDLNRILHETENDIRAGSQRLGRTIADETGKGVERNRRSVTRSVGRAVDGVVNEGIFSRLSKGIIDSIDDGLSGLPAELKIALGGALLAISPFIAAALTSAINIALIAGFAGLGILVGAQFQVVQDEFERLGSQLRTFFAELGNVFVQPILNAIDNLRTRIFALRGWFGEVFAVSATFIEPLAEALAGFIEALLPGLLDTLRNIQPLTEDLIKFAADLGRIIGEALRIISGSDDAAEGLRALTLAFGVLTLSVALLIRGLTEVFGLLVDIGQLVTNPEQFALDKALDLHAEATKNAASANGTFEESLKNLIAPTDGEKRRIDELNRSLTDYISNMFNSARANIGFEQSLDDMVEELTNGSRSLDINTQAGRDNQLSILSAAEALRRQRDETIRLTGNTAAANATFETNRKRLEDAAVAAGISRQRFRDLTGAILAVPSTVPIQIPLGPINAAIVRFGQLAAAIAAAVSGANQATRRPGGGGGGSATAYAEGGIVTGPTNALIGEAGAEAVIPLTKPARAAQLLNESGLSNLMGPTVNVYIGNQQLDAYIETRTRQTMDTTARELTYGSRGI